MQLYHLTPFSSFSYVCLCVSSLNHGYIRVKGKSCSTHFLTLCETLNTATRITPQISNCRFATVFRTGLLNGGKASVQKAPNFCYQKEPFFYPVKKLAFRANYSTDTFNISWTSLSSPALPFSCDKVFQSFWGSNGLFHAVEFSALMFSTARASRKMHWCVFSLNQSSPSPSSIKTVIIYWKLLVFRVPWDDDVFMAQ